MGALLLSSGMVVGAAAPAAADGNVNVCHRTDNDKNPYVYHSPAENSTELQGHLDHRNRNGGGEDKFWDSDGIWNGIEHRAGDFKPDYIEGRDAVVPTGDAEGKLFCQAATILEFDVPDQPAPTAPTCDTDGALTLPADTQHLTWTIKFASGAAASPVTGRTYGPGTYDVTVTSDFLPFEGGGLVRTFEDIVVLPATGGCPPGLIDLPTAPVVSAPDCDSAGSFTVSPTAGMTTFLDGVKVTSPTVVDAAGTYVIGYIAGPGTVFEGTGKTRATQTLIVLPATGGCPVDQEVTPRVDFVQPTCAVPSAGATAYVNGDVDATENHLENDLDTVDKGVVFRLTSSGDISVDKSVTITATAEPGFIFAGNKTVMTFDYTFNPAPTNCGGGGPTTVAPQVDFTNPTCADLDGADVDVVEKTGIVYTQTGTPGLGQTVTVTAKAQPGFQFAGGTKELVFSHTFPSIDDLECVAGTEAIRPAVSFTEASCEDLDGAGFSGMFTDIVDYTVAGDMAPGEAVVVTATIKPAVADQFAFPVGFDNTFEHTFAGFDESECVKGTQTSKPKPEDERPPTVLGTQTAVPTAVHAGLAGAPTAGGGSTTALLAQLMVGAGLLLLVAAGWTGLGGRRRRGVHQA